jgi:G patch domain-containing protein 1
MDSDSEDYCVVGTPLECEEEAKGYRKKVQDLAVTKSLPVHKQEATDDEGRRRFHGRGYMVTRVVTPGCRIGYVEYTG